MHPKVPDAGVKVTINPILFNVLENTSHEVTNFLKVALGNLVRKLEVPQLLNGCSYLLQGEIAQPHQ